MSSRHALPWLNGVALFLVACGPAAPTADVPAVSDLPSPQASPIVIALINEQRRQAGVPALREATRLARAAQLQATQMAATGRLDHVLPGQPHPRPEDRLAAAGYDGQAWGENLAMGGEPSDIVASWMASAVHRANILNQNYTETGVGLASDNAGRRYYVQVFGRPR